MHAKILHLKRWQAISSANIRRRLLAFVLVLMPLEPLMAQDLIITGVIDGPLTGGLPKAVEFYVINDIADLSIYGVQSANNGALPSTPEFTFPATAATAGSFIYLATEIDSFQSFFDSPPGYTNDNATNINGDDTIVLFQNGTIVDVFGEIGIDGTDRPWEHTDGWAYRKNGTGPDGATFVLENWSFSGVDALDGETTNAAATTPFPIRTYTRAGGDDQAPRVTSTMPSDGAVGVNVSTNILINFSEEVTVVDPWFNIDCNGNVINAAADSGPQTYTLTPTEALPSNTSCTVTVFAAGVNDLDGTLDQMAQDFVFSFTTAAMCGDPAILISEIQGSGLTSPLKDTVVSVEAIITTLTPGLRGFYIQEEEPTDDDPATSEGIFVFLNGPPDPGLATGNLVRVTGTVGEFETSNGASFQTQLTNSPIVTQCDTGKPIPQPTPLELPLDDPSDLEAFEGMLVWFPQELVISEYFNFDRFGEVVVSLPPNGWDRLYTPTAVVEPGAEAIALAAEYAKRNILIDDARSNQNPDPAIHPGNGGDFTLENRFRGGDTITGIEGVIDETFGRYRLHPTAYYTTTYLASNPRREQPDDVGGDLRVASINVLNYFLTLTSSGPMCGPSQNQDCRGADTAEELERQRAKILDALVGINGDIVGLVEMENTPGVEPAADLVDGLNSRLGPNTYDYIATGVIGDDAIRVGFIYKPTMVQPVGDFAILDSSVDPGFLDDKNRPALAQTFTTLEHNQSFTVVVNHFKSKGSDCNDVGDPDMSDGQGNCNLTRTAAAEALVEWLESDPTGSGEDRVLIIGDLNSYDKEDPIDELVAGGYTDLVAAFGGELAYSYLFDGQFGYLDHALASDGLLGDVTGTTVWHINADEPDILDYDTSFKQEPQQQALYEPNAFRSSDHDPVIVGLNLGGDSGQNKPLCSVLGNNRSRLLPDLDIFEFNGTAGEEVTVTLSPNPAGTHSGERATLTWSDDIRSVFFLKLDRSALPNRLSATLPADGRYIIAINEQPGFVAGKPFKGDYCLSVESSANAAQTMAPASSVE